MPTVGSNYIIQGEAPAARKVPGTRGDGGSRPASTPPGDSVPGDLGNAPQRGVPFTPPTDTMPKRMNTPRRG